MSTYTISGRGTVVGTNVRAIASLFGIASVQGAIREVGVFNTTAVAVAVGLIRFSAATNVGAGLTESKMNPLSPTPSCTGFAGHTGDGTTSGGIIRHAPLPAAVGGGVIWTFGGPGLLLPGGTADGVGIYIPTGTGQILDYYIDWEE